jgi:hypothetical protein
MRIELDIKLNKIKCLGMKTEKNKIIKTSKAKEKEIKRIRMKINIIMGKSFFTSKTITLIEFFNKSFLPQKLC